MAQCSTGQPMQRAWTVPQPSRERGCCFQARAGDLVQDIRGRGHWPQVESPQKMRRGACVAPLPHAGSWEQQQIGWGPGPSLPSPTPGLAPSMTSVPLAVLCTRSYSSAEQEAQRNSPRPRAGYVARPTPQEQGRYLVRVHDAQVEHTIDLQRDVICRERGKQVVTGAGDLLTQSHIHQGYTLLFPEPARGSLQ